MRVGRNDPCPCGSGAKYKRCCLDRGTELSRLVAGLEGLVTELGERAWERRRDEYLRAFERFYGISVTAFGWSGPDDAERLEADLWIVCDCVLGGRDTPLAEARREPGGDSRLLSALAESRLRPWRIETARGAELIEASCPLSGEAATLELARSAAGEQEAGRMLVARSVPREQGRYALLGRAPIVEAEAEADFEAMLEGLLAGDGGDERQGHLVDDIAVDPRELCAVHGDALARAAWSWPEERECTADGEWASEAIASWELDDLDAAIAALDGRPGLARIDPDLLDEPDVASWRLTPPAGEPAALPPAEPGVRWQLCPDDVEEHRLALIEVDPYDGRLWIHAASERRLQRGEHEARAALADLVGEQIDFDPGASIQSFRWQRERWERLEESLSRGGVSFRARAS